MLVLTRRGRFFFIGVPLMLLAALVIMLLGFVNSPATAAEAGHALHVSPTQLTTVTSGQTLWSVAAESAPERDTREVLKEIFELNDLDSSVIQPGQQLFVPAAD